MYQQLNLPSFPTFCSSSHPCNSFSSSSSKTFWSAAKPSSPPGTGTSCQQFTRPHPVQSNKETRTNSFLSSCQPPPSAHLLTFPPVSRTEAIDLRRPDGREVGGGGILALTEVVKIVLQSHHCILLWSFFKCSCFFNDLHSNLDRV